MISSHNWLMDFGNSLEVVMHYLQNGGETCLGYEESFPMVSVLACVVTH